MASKASCLSEESRKNEAPSPSRVAENIEKPYVSFSSNELNHVNSDKFVGEDYESELSDDEITSPSVHVNQTSKSEGSTAIIKSLDYSHLLYLPAVQRLNIESHYQ